MCMCDTIFQKIIDEQTKELEHKVKSFDEWNEKRLLECPLSKDLLDLFREEQDKLNGPIEDELKALGLVHEDFFWTECDVLFLDVQFDDLTKQKYFDRIMKSNEKATQEELEKAFSWLMDNDRPIINSPYISKIGDKYYF